MKRITRLLALMLALSFSIPAMAQDWIEMMKNPDVNFYDVQKAFNKYYVKKERQAERIKRRQSKLTNEGIHDEELEIPGFSQYKRWEWMMAPRVDRNGRRFDPSLAYREMEEYKKKYGTFSAGNWTIIGPTNSIPSGGGAGRLNFVRFDPNDPNTIYVGSPAGGLWKSSNGGASWSSNTDQLSQVIGCTDIAIDPTNSNIMYLATGDGDAGDTYTIGILKSTDGGLTWNTTGLSYYMANTRQISKLLIDPANTSTILAATSAGIFRSTDAGATFTLVQAGSFKDMEFKPGDPNIVYTAGTEFYRSTNNGQTWSKITTGIAAAATLSRIAIAVTPHDNNYVYLLAAKAATDYGFEGIYRSTNSGQTFSKVATSTPSNVLGWNSNGGDTGGQGWYDLAIAASPADKNEIIVGGVNIWRSTNGGSSFSINGHWTGSGAPYVHADVHDLIYVSGSTYFAGCDGGIFKTTNGGAAWTDLSDGLQIAQMYGFGQSTTNANLLIQGWQDNGTNRYNGTWSQVMGGDGMLCFIDWNNNQNMWGSQYEGSLNRHQYCQRDHLRRIAGQQSGYLALQARRAVQDLERRHYLGDGEQCSSWHHYGHRLQQHRCQQSMDHLFRIQQLQQGISNQRPGGELDQPECFHSEHPGQLHHLPEQLQRCHLHWNRCGCFLQGCRPEYMATIFEWLAQCHRYTVVHSLCHKYHKGFDLRQRHVGIGTLYTRFIPSCQRIRFFSQHCMSRSCRSVQ